MNDQINLREPQALAQIWQDTRAIGFTMASEPLGCSLVRTLAASKPGGRFLELGSGTGLSTAWLLDGMDARSHLTTLDNDESLLTVLKKNLGHDPRLSIVCADGDDFIRSLQGQTFDLIFADTWAGKYRCLPETLDLLAVGGLYIIDDMLPQANWPDGHADKASALIAQIESHPGFLTTKLAWASGIIVATKIGQTQI